MASARTPGMTVLRRNGEWVSLLDWGNSAFFGVLDQGLFAASGFITNILLARWLSAESFGAFALAYAVFLFLGTFYLQALPGPMLVFGAGKYAERFRRYLAILFYGHIGITASISAVLLAVAVVVSQFGSRLTVHALIALAVAAPGILFLWLARYAFYARLKPHWAAAGSALYLVMTTVGIYGLAQARALSPVSALLLMGANSLIVGSFLAVVLRPQWCTSLAGYRRGFGAVARFFAGEVSAESGRALTAEPEANWGLSTVLYDHYHFAKWSSAASAASWFVTNLHYFALSSSAGLGSVAAMRVLDTALSPFFNIQTAMSRLLLPALGKRSRRADNGLLADVIRISALWASLAIGGYSLLRAFAPDILALLYGGAYSQYGSLLGLYGLIVISTSIAEPILSLLRAMIRNDLVFLYQLAFAASLFTGYVIEAGSGLSGIISVMIVVHFCILPVGLVLARLVCSSGPGVPDEVPASHFAE